MFRLFNNKKYKYMEKLSKKTSSHKKKNKKMYLKRRKEKIILLNKIFSKLNSSPSRTNNIINIKLSRCCVLYKCWSSR